MELIGDFNTKVYETSDKKKLKDHSKTYTYGTVSIRDPKLNEYIGSDVIIRIFKKNENDPTFKHDADSLDKSDFLNL